ncbi:33392_t:CDS:2 [Racocetra persica]|uniref:33392_t:CDS:1 n=1 Tax=Racocetra persica TaxID=160502 RepID=A0ACA9KGP7_9GLOM|nr:33392_t:CDS:2 [Racocetra persica]
MSNSMYERKWYQHAARTITIYEIKYMNESGNNVKNCDAARTITIYESGSDV